MVKKVIIMLFVLSVVVSANAGLTVVIKGDDGLWWTYADSKYTITPSTEIEYGIMDDGATPTGTYALGVASGLGSLGDNIVLYQSGVTAVLTDDSLTAANLGLQNMFVSMDLTESVGQLVWSGTFHCDGPGDVTLAAVNYDGLVQDTQVIHQVPEPATLALLGIGCLVLRRRRRAA